MKHLKRDIMNQELGILRQLYHVHSRHYDRLDGIVMHFQSFLRPTETFRSTFHFIYSSWCIGHLDFT